jgi:UPF0716 family protein affecting phage T7 exclusion
MLALAIILALYVIGMLMLSALQLELHFRRTRDSARAGPDASARLGAAGLSG